MHQLAPTIGLAVVLFVSTNVDDIFVLLAFFADSKFKLREVVVGQLIGLLGLYSVSVAGSLISLVVPAAYVGVLGLAPIVIGLKKLWEFWRGADGNEEVQTDNPGHGNIVAVAAITLANGGDNIGVYTPVFATRPGFDIVVIGVVFAIMTMCWLAVAHWLTNHRTLGAPIRRYGHRMAPLVLIALGILILSEAGTVELLRR